MSIKSILIEKFKSYSNCKIDGLNDRINIIYGKNGSGKSNLLAALSFLCSDQYDRADRAQLMKNYKEGNPKVEISINNLMLIDSKKDMTDSNNVQKVIPTSGDNVILSRSLEERENMYRVDERSVSLNQFNNIFECFGISRKNPFTIVAQNRIQEISNMTDSEIYKLLQQVSGIEAFVQKQEKAEELFNKSQKEKQGIEASLQEVEDKISQLSGEKEQYAQNQEQDILIQSLQSLLYDKLKEEISNKKADCNKEINVKNEKLQEEKSKLQDLEQQKENKQEEIQRLKEKLQRITVIEDQVKSDQSAIDVKIKNLNNNLEELKSIKENKDEKKIEQRLKQINLQCTKLQDEIDVINNQATKEKDQIESKQSDYEKYMLRDKFKTEKEKEEYFNKRNKDIQSNISEKLSSQKQLKQKTKEYEKKLNYANSEVEKLESKVQEQSNESNTLQKQLNDKKNQIQKFRQEQLEKRKVISDKKIELDDLNDKMKKKVDDLQKQLKSGLIQTIEKIEEAIEKDNIQGYKGLLIDHLEFNSDLTYAYDIASKGKLFSLIVDNEKTASQIMDIVKNIGIKSANLNIIPLNWIEDDIENEREYQIGFGFQKLFDKKYIKAKGEHASDILRLAKSIFEKYGVVKEYEEALEVAAKYGVNCITLKKQVVYSGGFISHVGYCAVSKIDKIKLYQEHKQIKIKRDQLKSSIKQIEDEIQKIEQDQNNINQSINQQQLQFAKLSNSIFITRQLLKSTLMEKLVIIDEDNHNNQLIEQITTQLTELENEQSDLNKKSQKYTPLTPEDKKQMYSLQDVIKKSTASYQNILKQKAALESKYNESRSEEQQLSAHLASIAENNNPSGSELFSSIDDKIKNLENDLKHQQTILKTQKEIVQKTSDSKKQLQKQITKLEEESNEKVNENVQKQKEVCNNLEQQVAAILLRKQQFILKEQEIDTKKEQLQINPELIQKYSNLSKDSLRNKQNRIISETTVKKYTARDKILFEKIKDLDLKYEEYKKKYTELTENEETAKNLIEQFRQKCDATIKMAFSKFEYYIKNYFKSIAPMGTIEVKFMHNQEISISLTFKQSNNDTKKTNRKELSGGEKSCLAILILMALQRCDPAPFYIFDEFDAALDAGYILPIAKIIQENSDKSQFLIVSHKQEFLQSLRQENCKCFQITLRDKISEIEEKPLSAAINFVKNG